MTWRSLFQRSCCLGLLLVLASCQMPVDAPDHDNTKDPASPYWTTERPDIYNVGFMPDSTVFVNWVSSTKYAVGFRIERRIALTGTYSLVGTIGGSAETNSFIDRTPIPRGHTYGYRVGVMGSAGAITYSFDYHVDIF